MGKASSHIKPDYQKLFSRNIGIFSKQQQEKLKQSKILIIGCGLGSIIAELAAKTGFVHIILVDGDSVDISNLNRQVFKFSEIGKNKAQATADHIKSINPSIKVQYFPQYLESNDCFNIIKNSDVIIDTLDIAALPVIVALHRAARQQKKVVLFPLNMGWGSGLFIFNHKSTSIEQMMALDTLGPLEDIPFENLIPIWSNLITKYIENKYLKNLLNKFLDDVKIKGWCPVPQLGIASYITASLTISAAVKSIFGFSLQYAPKMYLLDAHDVLS